MIRFKTGFPGMISRHAACFMIPLVLAFVLLARGCAATDPGHPKSDCITYDRVHHAYEFSNGTVRLVILPRIGRAMWYGYVGGRNILLDNSTNAESLPQGNYRNWGGDKAWIWPQVDWQMLTSAAWPPPPAMDGLPWQATVTAPCSLRLTSPLITPWNVYIQRDVSMDETGTRVVWKTRILADPAAPPHQSVPALAAWSITQIMPPDLLRARLLSSSPPAYKTLMNGQWKRVWQDGPWLNFTRDPSTSVKVGMDADRFEATLGNVIFTQTLTPSVGSDKGYQPMERAQIYSQPDPAGDHTGTPGYVEIEFTSPRVVPTNTVGPELTVTWQLAEREK